MYQRLNQLSIEVGSWAGKNFPVHAPDLGMLEEIGELCHCFLKRLQGIRGFDNPSVFHEHADDAIADIAVYNLHSMFLNQVELESDPVCRPGLELTAQPAIRRFFHHLSRDISAKLGGQVHRANRWMELCIFDHLVTVADAIEIDFMDNLEKTWARVSKRDWVKSPENAHLVSSAPEEYDRGQPG